MEAGRSAVTGDARTKAALETAGGPRAPKSAGGPREGRSIVAVDGLVKRYGEVLALDHFSLRIEPGEVFGLLGPNGSGKTTAINCILQLLTYDKGTIELFGQPMRPCALRL